MVERMPSATVRAVRERSEDVCEAMIPEAGCVWQAQHLHHRKLRSQGVDHSPENVVHICGNCHVYIHSHTGWAYDNGLLVRGWDVPEFPPHYYRGIVRS